MTAAPEYQRVGAIVAAAGSGQRLGAQLPKALVALAGHPLLTHSVAALVRGSQLHGRQLQALVVVAPPGFEDQAKAAAVAGAGTVPVAVVVGGATRVESVARGLAALADVDLVLVHDAARALVPAQVVADVIAALAAGAEAVVPGLPVVDTIRQISPDGSSTTLPRASLRAVQTPQGFTRESLLAAHASGVGASATDDAGMVEAIGRRVTIVSGHPEAMKVTTPLDLAVAGLLLAERERP